MRELRQYQQTLEGVATAAELLGGADQTHHRIHLETLASRPPTSVVCTIMLTCCMSVGRDGGGTRQAPCNGWADELGQGRGGHSCAWDLI